MKKHFIVTALFIGASFLPQFVNAMDREFKSRLETAMDGEHRSDKNNDTA